MYKEAKGNNVLLFTKLFELGRKIAFIAVKDNHTIYPLSPYSNILVEMLNPIYSCLIIGLAIWRSLDHLKRREVSVDIPKGKIIGTLYN